MRRKLGTLVPLEIDILHAAVRQAMTDTAEFHGFQLARLLADADGSRSLTAHGTLYKALARLADSGMLAQRWEDPEVALLAGRPRRRLYWITGLGEGALQHAIAEALPFRQSARRLGIEPS